MASLSGTVGHGGRNAPADVKIVQQLLNRHRMQGVRHLIVDGITGPATIGAIRHFQSEKVGMRNPDGRVDPGGRTIRALRSGEAAPSSAQTPPAPAPAEQRRTGRQRRRDFVDPRVREIAKTTQIIDAIEPHFRDVQAKVISGYLNDSDLFWKVNYHWEYLLWMIDHSLTLDIADKHKSMLRSIRSNLVSVKPDPDQGYRTSRNLGRPADRSSYELFDRRYKIVRQAKRDFKQIVRAADLIVKSSRGSDAFGLAYAPVAHPGTSKHSTGYALDIKGDNSGIASVAKNLGATMTFDEQNHVHVEFKKGAPRG